MQRPSYEPFDPQQNSHAPPPYGNPSGAVSGGYSHVQYNQQQFGQQTSPGFSRYDVDQSVDNALSMLTNPDILNSLTSMVQQPLPQQPHAYNMPQQHHHSNGAYPPNPGPAGGTYAHRPNAPSYPPSHQMPGPGGLHDSRGQMFDGGSGQHAHRAMDAPPPHHMVQGIPPTGTGALVSRGSFPFDARGGQAPPQRPAAYPPPSRPDPRQPILDDRTREYRGMEMGSYVGQAAPMQRSRVELEQLPHAMAHLQGGGRDMGAGAGGLDVMGRRAPMDYRQSSHDMNRGPHAEAYGGPGGAAQTGAFRGPAPAAFTSGDYERANMPGNYNYREVPPNDFRGGVEARNRDESRLHRGGGSLLDAYSSEQPRFSGASAAAPPLSRNSLDGVRRGGESLLDQYGGGEMDLRGREVGRGGGGGGSNRWDNRRSPSPPYARPTREAKFGLPGRQAREPLPSAYPSKYDRRRSRSPIDRRVASREGVRRSPKDSRGAKGDEEVPPTKELFVGSIRDGTTEAHVQEAFSKFGPIDSLAVKANRHFGFVNFKNLSDAVRAKREMEGKPLATSIRLSIQFTKVERRGGDDGRPERRIEREPIQRENQPSPASPSEQQQQSDTPSQSPSQQRLASPTAEAVDDRREDEQVLEDAVPSASDQHAPDS